MLPKPDRSRVTDAASDSACPAGPFRALVLLVFTPPATPPLPTAAFAERFAVIIDGLCVAIATSGAGWVLRLPLVFLLRGLLRRTAICAANLATPLAADARPPATAALPCLGGEAGARRGGLRHPTASPAGRPAERAARRRPKNRRLLNPPCRMFGAATIPRRSAAAGSTNCRMTNLPSARLNYSIYGMKADYPAASASSSSVSAAAANTRMLAARSADPVSSVRTNSAPPATARQVWPAASP